VYILHTMNKIGRKFSYYIPLIPRRGVPYFLTDSDRVLINKEVDEKYIEHQQELVSFHGKSVIPDDEFNHFVMGGLFRTVIHTFYSEGMLMAPTILSLGCNDANNNKHRIEELQKELKNL